MTGGWREVAVADVVDIASGGTPKRSVPEYWSGDIQWASAKDIANSPGRILRDTQETITEEGVRNSATKLMPAGTIIITARGTVGAMAQLGSEMAFNQTCYASPRATTWTTISCFTRSLRPSITRRLSPMARSFKPSRQRRSNTGTFRCLRWGSSGGLLGCWGGWMTRLS